ncbi:MAG TPA: FAD-dependent oxidoreductase [Burkholderiaceae bacterium]|nr:FAD-dependent oxidoreductase [Burkholderiaceae bacterium]
MGDRASDSNVIVVGGGIAGIVAALELAQGRRRVLLLDRDVEGNFGGQARESFGGIFAVDTPIQRRSGIHDSASLALADWQRFGEIGPEDGWPYRWAHAYVHECRREVFDWLGLNGVRFLPVPLWPERKGNSVARWHIVWGTGQELTLRLIAQLKSHSHWLDLRFGHRVERLLVENGRVRGVAGGLESSDERFELHGSTVLIASGGIAGDLGLVRRFWPPEWGPAPRQLLNGAHRFGDGRVQEACKAVGAQITNMQRMWNYAAGVRHWRARQADHGLSLVPPRSALWLDSCGRRFEPPLLAGWDTSELVARIAAGGGLSWQVLNRRIALRELAVSGAEFNPAIRERRKLALLRDVVFGNRWLLKTMSQHCPDFVQADTVPQLVQRMNALLAAGTKTPPQEVRLQWVEEALQAFEAARTRAAGEDDLQWKNIRLARLWKADRWRTARPGPILQPGAGPLIAICERIISRKSLGGISSDLDGRALDASAEPIAGLFVAGEAAGFGGGGMNGRRALEGTFLGGCIYSARRAARGILRDSARDAPR